MLNEIEVFVDDHCEVDMQLEKQIYESPSRVKIHNASSEFTLTEINETINDSLNNKPSVSSVQIREQVVNDHIFNENELISLNDSNNILNEPDNLKMKLTQLPLSRIKNIMKLDRDVTLTAQGVVFLISKSTELFIQTLTRDSHIFTLRNKKKTIQMRDIESAITEKDYFAFLEGAL